MPPTSWPQPMQHNCANFWQMPSVRCCKRTDNTRAFTAPAQPNLLSRIPTSVLWLKLRANFLIKCRSVMGGISSPFSNTRLSIKACWILVSPSFRILTCLWLPFLLKKCIPVFVNKRVCKFLKTIYTVLHELPPVSGLSFQMTCYPYYNTLSVFLSTL